MNGFDTNLLRTLIVDNTHQQVLANTVKNVREIMRENIRKSSLKMQIKDLDMLIENIDKSLERL